MTPVETVFTDAAPAPAGQYSQGRTAAGVLYCASQIPIDPATGELVAGSARAQADRCLTNLDAVCRAAGTSLELALRVTVYFVDRAVMAAVDQAFAARFAGDPPARVPVHVQSLGRGADVAMDAVVALPR